MFAQFVHGKHLRILSVEQGELSREGPGDKAAGHC